MKLEYSHCPESQPFDSALVESAQTAEFLSYTPDFTLMADLAKEYESVKNILVIGHGGSITSFGAIYSALESSATKKAYILSTVDPDYISELKTVLSPQETLVIAISKSGETTTQIEALSQFLEYPLLFITGEGSPLAQIAEKRGGKVVAHPSIGGRYTAFTEVALLPAALCGFDVKSLFNAGRAMHIKFGGENEAWKAASAMAQLEARGYVDVFLPFYSHALFGSSNLIVQLCHESFGKNDLGQTYFAHESPESQHHTNQRFLGGRRDVAGFFVSVEKFNTNLKIAIGADLQDIKMKDGTLAVLNNLPLENSMHYELRGTLEDAARLEIPSAHLSVSEISASNLGEYLAFWQLYAVYSSLMRDVNPFDQPAVEHSKIISFAEREKFAAQ